MLSLGRPNIKNMELLNQPDGRTNILQKQILSNFSKRLVLIMLKLAQLPFWTECSKFLQTSYSFHTTIHPSISSLEKHAHFDMLSFSLASCNTNCIFFSFFLFLLFFFYFFFSLAYSRGLGPLR